MIFIAMCGIAGIILKHRDDRNLVERVANGLAHSLEHRGPDASGVHLTPRRAFLNRRLAIVGIEGGDQPIYATSGNAGIVYNGELYNYLTLKHRYEQAGAVFTTHTDTEVVLQAYLHDRESGLEMLDGMFAFCLWDDDNGEILLVRDGFGIKPLYLYEDPEKIIFSSEIRAIMSIPGVDLSLNPAGVKDYLTFRYVISPLTLFERIRRITPGTYLVISNQGEIRERNFSDLCSVLPERSRLSFSEAADELRRLVLESVESHLIGEVPIALLLSGGVDSSILAAALNALDVDMKAFNVGFPQVNEFQYSTAVANRHGLDLHNLEITAQELADNAGPIVEGLDEPIADPAQFPLFLLSARIREFATVVLSGEGADELFAGYPQYGLHDGTGTWSQLLPDFLAASHYFLDNRQLLHTEPVDGGWPRTRKYFLGPSTLRSMANYDFNTWVPDNLMMKADKILMRHSLEGRFPFLNRKIHDFCASLPDSFFIDDAGNTKRVLREAFRDDLPESVLSRPKMGFTVPVEDLLKHFADAFYDATGTIRQTEIAELLNIDAAESTFRALLDGKTSLALRSWTLFVLVRWLAANTCDASRNAAA